MVADWKGLLLPLGLLWELTTQTISNQTNPPPPLPLTRNRALAVLGPHLIAASNIWGV